MKVDQLSNQDLLARIEEQENRLVFDQFDIELAHHVGQRLVELGKAGGLPIAVDVTRGGQCLFHCSLKGATPDNAQWIARKNRVVQRFHHSSLYMGIQCKLAGKSLEERYHLPPNEFASHGGAFPIRLAQSGVVGTVTVSGLPQIDDHELVVSVLETLV